MAGLPRKTTIEEILESAKRFPAIAVPLKRRRPPEGSHRNRIESIEAALQRVAIIQIAWMIPGI